MVTKEVLEKINEVIEMRKKSSMDRDCVVENRVIGALCLKADAEPREVAKTLNDQYPNESPGYTVDDVIRVLRGLRIPNKAERSSLFQFALELADAVYEFFNGDLIAYKTYKEREKKSYDSLSLDVHTTRMRCVLIALFTKYPQFQKLPFGEDVYYRGGVRSKACLNDIVNRVYKYLCTAKHTEEPQEEQLAQKDEQIRRLHEMIEELHNEFERNLEESKTQERTSFFSALNSERYGYILDGLFDAQAGLDSIRKKGYEPPVELNGVLILVRKLIQFVKDSGIRPQRRTGERLTVKSQDIEGYNYIGSPFVTEGEEKCVEVISPGWEYKEKEIHLSRPTIKEVPTP